MANSRTTPSGDPSTQQIATVVGFDFGTRKIGVAAGQSLTGSASPLEAIRQRDSRPDWQAINAILEEWRPDALVVGLPLNMDDSESELSRRARRFARQLQGRFQLPAFLVDERLSTREARERLGARARKGPDPRVDSLAAVLIIESFFNQGGGQRP
jgi:putative Holliday junction resolvase